MNLKVVEISHGSVGASFCGMVLQQLGMQVVKVEMVDCPDTLREKHPFPKDAPAGPGLSFRFLNSAKELSTLDLRQPADSRAWESLLDGADVLIQGGNVAEHFLLDGTALRKNNPELIDVAISALGLAAVRAGEVADDFVAYHRCGLGFITPRTMPGFPTAGMRPLSPYSRILELLSGYQAAIAVLALLFRRSTTGKGDSVDLAAIQCALPLLRREMAAYQYHGWIATRGARSWVVAPSGIQRCSDGHVFVAVIEERQWRNLCRLMGVEELVDDPRFKNHLSRFENNDALHPIMEAWFSARTKAVVTELGQQNIVPIAPVNAPSDLFENPQLVARNYFQDITTPTGTIKAPGLAFKAERMESRPPVKLSATSSKGPLAGLRILELTHVWAGPLCGQIMADLGAEVIRLESRRRIDIHRSGSPFAGNEPGINRSGVWNSQNRGKLSCTIDLSTPEGRELAKSLIAKCDAVIENFSPGTLDRMGLGFDTLKSLRPGIILVSLSAYGQTGPQRHYRGYGPMIDADCGVMDQTDYGDGVPRSVNGWLGDIGGATSGAVSLLAALLHRSPQHAVWCDIAEFEAAVLFQFDGLLAWSGRGERAKPTGNLMPYGHFTECVPCLESDAWIAISCAGQTQLDALAGIIGARAPKLSVSPSNVSIQSYRDLIAALAAWTQLRLRKEAVEILRLAGITCGPVSNIEDLLQDPVLLARGAFCYTNHSELGMIQSYGPVWSFKEQPFSSELSAPCMGEHNAQIFNELLGLDNTVIADLIERKVIH